MTEIHKPLPELDVRACWDLLRRNEIGRLAIVVDGRPEIFPVNYVADHGSIVLFTAPGMKLTGSVHGALVAFEIDGYDRGSKEAWSVVAKGQGREVNEMHELISAADLPLRPWHGGPKNHVVRLEPQTVTGRRFVVAVDPGGPVPEAARRTPDE